MLSGQSVLYLFLTIVTVWVVTAYLILNVKLFSMSSDPSQSSVIGLSRPCILASYPKL